MTKKILIIEDEPAQATTINLAMQKAGFETLIAGDGIAGLDLAKNILPDLILLDLVLPKMDGINVLKHLRADESTAKIPILVLTNLASGESVKEVIEAGGTEYMVKTDYTLDQLIQKVGGILK